jgi:hypothetical protein
MRKLSAKWIPKCLKADQKSDRVLASQAILDRFRLDPVGFLNRLVNMDESWIHIYDSRDQEQSKKWSHSGFPRPKKTQKSSSKVLVSLLGQRRNFACRLPGKGCNHHGKGRTTLHFSTNWSSNWSQNVEASFRRESCFFTTMPLLTRRPLHTRDWKIFTLTFRNTRPIHLIWPLRTTTSFITSRNTSGEESFRALRRPH